MKGSSVQLFFSAAEYDKVDINFIHVNVIPVCLCVRYLGVPKCITQAFPWHVSLEDILKEHGI